MPISKRDKKVSLTKTTKKGMKLKQDLVESIRRSLDKYHSIYVFAVDNMRTSPLQDVREEWKDSRFYFAKRKVMARALGRNVAEETEKNLHKLAQHLVGQCGLLFTNQPKDYVLNWFREFSKMDYAKSGFVATETVTLLSGPLPEFSFAIESHLRTLGLPTKLEKGVIVLREDYTVCTKDTKLSPEQASILKLIGKQMAEFKITLLCMWSKDGSFKKFKISSNDGIISKNSKETPSKETKKSKMFNETDTSKIKKVIPKQIETEIPMDEEQTEDIKSISGVIESLTIEKTLPRRSLRTPKPIKKSLDQPKSSVKKLTKSAKGTPQTLTTTPKRQKRKSTNVQNDEVSE